MRSAWVALLVGSLLGWSQLRADAEVDKIMQFFEDEGQVATATKYKVALKDAPASIQVVTAADIERFGYRNVAEALAGLTGLFVVDDANYEYLGVRGVNILGDYGSRVLMLVDGNDPIWGQAVVGNEGSVDISLVKRIEVVMGPGSAIYGSHAMLAVVNVITKDAEDLAGGGPWGGGLEGGYGSYNSATGRFQMGGQAGGLDYVMGGALLGSSGQDVHFDDAAVAGLNHGTAAGADREDAAKALLKLAYRGFSLEGTYVNRQKWLPTSALGSDFNDPRTSTIDGGWMGELKWAGNLGHGLELMVRGHARDTWYWGDYAAYGSGDGNVKQLSDGAWGGAEAQANWDSGRGNHVTLGGEMGNDWRLVMRSWSSSAGTTLDTTNSYSQGSGYVQDLYKPLEWATLVGGLRYDHYSTFGGAWSPRAGLLFDAPGANTFKLLWGTAFNAPPTGEMYWDDKSSQMANPNLKPERLVTYEAIWQNAMNKALGFTLSAYHNTMTDMCGMADDAAYSLPIYENAGMVITKGADLTLHGDLAGLRYTLGYCYQQSVDVGTGLVLADSAPDSGHAGLSWPLLQRKLYVSADAVYAGMRQTYNGAWLSPNLQSNLTLFGAALLPNLNLTLKVRNLFDSVYTVPMGEMPAMVEAVPGDRRNYEARVGVQF